MPIPCVKNNTDGLAIFQATADQRFALGEKAFLETHLPVRFWLRHAGTDTTWTEQDLLATLLRRSPTVQGNRVFVLFGAAGSGKSEVMRWLMLQAERADAERGRFCIRIARTELDPVRIVSKVLSSFDAPGLDGEILGRWENMKRKPVALANQMVWQALAGMYESDEQILPLSYRLRAVVEANLRAGFAALDEPEAVQRPLQLLTREQLEQVLGESVQDVEPVYEQLRARLQGAFEQLALGGISLIASLREISRSIRARYGIRPMLVVDDLVQSMNIYASDLLDYLITLEEGDWDVVVGLTPAAFEWDRRGRELLMRIRELDTVDDRVVKLDLSDTTGDTSAFLNEESAPEFLAPYLAAYKKTGGYTCARGECPHWDKCVGMQWGQQDSATLSPLNPAFIRRLWRRLPQGKGRVRYLLLAARTALEHMAVDGPGSLEALAELIDRDVYVSHADRRTRTLLECYYPGEGAAQETLPAVLAEVWEVTAQEAPSVHELRQTAAPVQAERAVPGEVELPAIDPGRGAVRDWLEGGAPNPELLKPLRVAVARFLRETVDPALLAGVGHAQPNAAMRWSTVQDGVHLPLPIEGLDAYAGIAIRRDIGSGAFALLTYGEARGPARSSAVSRLLANRHIVALLFYAEEQRQSWQAQLEAELGIPVPELAFHMYRVALSLGADLVPPAVLCEEQSYAVAGLAWPSELVRVIRLLWEDCFRLRDHLYDGERIGRYCRRWSSASDSLLIVRQAASRRLSDSFRLCDRPLGDVIRAVREHLDRLGNAVLGGHSPVAEWVRVADACDRLLDGRSRAALQRRWHALTAVAAPHLVIPDFPPGPTAEDLQLVSEFLVTAKERKGFSDLPGRYRLTAAWGKVHTSPWLLRVITWLQDVRSLFQQAHAFHARAGCVVQGVAVAESLPVLLERAKNLLVDAQQQMALTARVQAARDTLHAPFSLQYRVLAKLLISLTPENFAVIKLVPEQRSAAAAQIKACGELEAWLTQGVRGNPPPTLPVPDALSVTQLQQAVREVCYWWMAYVQQMPLLHERGHYAELKGPLGFLREAAQFRLPPEAAASAWYRFLDYASRCGTTELPVWTLPGRADLPGQLRRWFELLTKAGAKGLTLSDLPPQTLADLQSHTPEWTETIRLSLVPEGVTDGVLRVVDG